MIQVTSRIVLLVLVVGMVASAGHATLLQDHFGVTPQVQLISNWNTAYGPYTGYQFVGSSMAPTLHADTADLTYNDWFGYWDGNIGQYVNYPGTGTYPSGEEPYDTEAYYFDDDEDNLYFCVVVGFPSPESGIYMEDRFLPPLEVTQGDFALDTPYVTGSQQDGWGFQYDYGVDLVDENRPSSGNVTSFASETLGSDIYRTTTGWYLGTPDGAVNPVTGNESNAFTNFDPNSPYNPAGTMTNVGSATVSWYELDIQYGGSSVQENNWDTYVIEITIPRSSLVALRPGDQLQFHWLMGCRNDGSDAQGFMTGSGDIDFPEPGTFALLALGAGPLGVWMRKRRQRDS